MGETPRPARIHRAISTTTAVAIAATLSLLVAGGAGIFMRKQAHARAEAELKREAAEARARAEAAAARTLMQLTVVVDPATARLSVDGAHVAGPLLHLQRDGARHVLRVEADGFLPQDQPFLAAGDQMIAVALKKKGRPRGPSDLIKRHDDEGLDPKQLEMLEKMMKQLGSDANGALSTP